MNIALWIRGGGMRSVAYAGFIEGILETRHYTISRVIRNSGGSIIAAMLALDMPMKSAIDYFETFSKYIQLALTDRDSKSSYSKDTCTFVDIPMPTHSLFERKKTSKFI